MPQPNLAMPKKASVVKKSHKAVLQHLSPLFTFFPTFRILPHWAQLNKHHLKIHCFLPPGQVVALPYSAQNHFQTRSFFNLSVFLSQRDSVCVCVRVQLIARKCVCVCVCMSGWVCECQWVMKRDEKVFCIIMTVLSRPLNRWFFPYSSHWLVFVKKEIFWG